MTKTPIKTSGEGADSFLLKMKEFYQVKERRENKSSSGKKPDLTKKSS